MLGFEPIGPRALSKPPKHLLTLTVRAHFQRVRGGGRFACALFVIEAKPRPEQERDAFGDGARFGLTVSKKIGNAVVRNRVKRRLRAALPQVRALGLPAADHVIIARPGIDACPYAQLVAELERGLRQIASRSRAPKPNKSD